MTRHCIWLIAILMSALAAPTYAQSSKAAWRFSELVALDHAVADTDPATPTGAIDDTYWVNILTTHVKTPNAKEIAIGVSLQCGIVTDTTVRSKGGDLDTAAAQGQIKVRVKLTPPGGGDPVYAEPNNGADLTDVILDPLPGDNDGVTYCDRYQKLAARFAGLNCTVDAEGVVTCEDPEELQLVLKTLNAHHFNFIYANATPGVHKIQVQARARAGVELGCASATVGEACTPLGAAGAEAFAGAGALSVEVIRLIKDADGTTDLEDLR